MDINIVSVRFKALQVGQQFTYRGLGAMAVRMEKVSSRTAKHVDDKGALLGRAFSMRDDAVCDIPKPQQQSLPLPHRMVAGGPRLETPDGWCCVWVKHEELVRLQRMLETAMGGTSLHRKFKEITDGWLADPKRQIRNGGGQ